MPITTGIVKDKRFLGHDAGPFHPESPARLEAIQRMIKGDSALASFHEIIPRPATEEEIRSIHTAEHIALVRGTAGKPRFSLDGDTSTSPLSYETALFAAGSAIKAADLIMEKTIRNAFAFIRPPGHHAEAGQAMGFCIFNNVAVAAEHLIRRHGLRRILIVDWDVHHGNGTQHSFYSRKDVFYFSTHLFPHYPGTGWWDEIGSGEGKGFTFNVPLSPGKTDADFIHILRRILAPAASKYRPEFILVSAGFDIADGDPLGGMRITPAGFAAITAELTALAGEFCSGRLLCVLEGGYDLKALREGSREVLLELGGLKPPQRMDDTVSPAVEKELSPALRILKQYE